MPAYVVVIREKTTDTEQLQTYSAKAPASLAGHEVKPRAFYQHVQAVEGDQPEGVVILEFPTIAAAEAWYNSPASQAAAAHRHAGSQSRVLIVQGVG